MKLLGRGSSVPVNPWFLWQKIKRSSRGYINPGQTYWYPRAFQQNGTCLWTDFFFPIRNGVSTQFGVECRGSSSAACSPPLTSSWGGFWWETIFSLRLISPRQRQEVRLSVFLTPGRAVGKMWSPCYPWRLLCSSAEGSSYCYCCCGWLLLMVEPNWSLSSVCLILSRRLWGKSPFNLFFWASYLFAINWAILSFFGFGAGLASCSTG